MHFCPKCDNMLYISVNFEPDSPEANRLVYYCRNCGHKDNTIGEKNFCVSHMQLKKTEQKFSHLVNKYTKYDPTLPRVTNIACPNSECPSNTDKAVGKDVIYMRYDDDNMLYVYICRHCDHTWTIK